MSITEKFVFFSDVVSPVFSPASTPLTPELLIHPLLENPTGKLPE